MQCNSGCRQEEMEDEDDEDAGDGRGSLKEMGEASPSAQDTKRKTPKPLMEKRRRARFNNCLKHLKTLVMDASRDRSRHSKVEKADILEMTVQHLKRLQRHQTADSGLGSEPRLTGSYRAGFNDCTQEVIRYLSQNEVDPGLRSRITSHLTHSPRSPDRLLPRPTTILTFRESSLPVQLHLPVMSAISANQTAIMQTVPFQTVGQQQNKNGDTSADLCILNRCLFIGQPDTHDHQLQMLPKMASNTYRCGEIALVVPDHNQTMNQIPVIPLYANTEVATRNVSGEKRPIDISEKSSATSVHTLSLGEGLKDIMGDQDVKVDDVIGVCKNMTACMTVSVKRTVEEVHTNEREDAVICDVVRRSQRDDAVKCDVTHTHKREDADKYDVVHRSQREENKDAVHQKETKPDDAHMDDSWRPWL